MTQSTQWRPISEAPKDGTMILACGTAYAELAEDGFRWFTADTDKPRKPLTCVIRWTEGWYDKEVDMGDGSYRKERALAYAYWGPHAHAFCPTHWMPLPPPPLEEKEPM